ncbi:MAG TPA: hypothetical protein ENI42_07175 [Thermoplasmatales archaeon]|nr:hypothetical protein [Thermoplasmatales archaeon]
MHSDVDRVYECVKDLMTKEEFHREIVRRKKEVDGLLDDEAVAMLIVDELGRNRKHITAIKDLKPDEECTVFGKVVSIDEPLEFKRKNGSKGRVINLKIADNTGSCVLALWDDDVDLVGSVIRVGSTIKVVNGYTRERNSEIEVNVGRWGSIEVEPTDAPVISNHVESRIEGRVVKKEGTRPYFKDDGEFGFVRTIMLESDDGLRRIILWGEHTKTVESIDVGEKIVITNVHKKSSSGCDEFHVNSHSVITKS